MTDPLRHEDLTCKRTRIYAGQLQATINHVLHEEPQLPALVAAALAFIDACENAEVDVFAVLDQVVEADERGLLTPTFQELEQMRLPFDAIH